MNSLQLQDWNSTLFVIIVFRNGERNILYGKQMTAHRCWDNANHHRQLGTFPFHKHIEITSKNSTNDIRKVLNLYRKKFRNNTMSTSPPNCAG